MSYNLTYAENNTLASKFVGGWGGAVGSNTRGDVDKKGWTQAGNFVHVDPKTLYAGGNNPTPACQVLREHKYPLGGSGLEQINSLSQCSSGLLPARFCAGIL
jgi:hypothetical protein